MVPVLMLAAAKPVARPEPKHAAPRAPQQHRTGTSPEVIKAQEDLSAVEKRLRDDFEKGDDFTKADAALKQAQGDYDAAVKAAVDKIKDKPEYAAAVDALKKVEDEQITARLNPGAKVDPELAGRVMDARMAVHKLEIDAGDADPAAKDAKAKVIAAKEAMGALRGKFDESMRQDADYVAAKKALDDARAAARAK